MEFPRDFDVRVLRHADAVILVMVDYPKITRLARKAFHLIHNSTELRNLPVLCLLLNPMAEREELSKDRLTTIVTRKLRPIIQRHESLRPPFKVFLIRPSNVKQDTERAFLWLWARSGLGDRLPREVLPLNSSSTMRRYTHVS